MKCNLKRTESLFMKQFVTVHVKINHSIHFIKIKIITSLDSAKCAEYANTFVFFYNLQVKNYEPLTSSGLEDLIARKGCSKIEVFCILSLCMISLSDIIFF